MGDLKGHREIGITDPAASFSIVEYPVTRFGLATPEAPAPEPGKLKHKNAAGVDASVQKQQIVFNAPLPSATRRCFQQISE
jgi:hypothetical protein